MTEKAFHEYPQTQTNTVGNTLICYKKDSVSSRIIETELANEIYIVDDESHFDYGVSPNLYGIWEFCIDAENKPPNMEPIFANKLNI